MRQATFTVMVIYHQLLPKWELTPFRCTRCSRMLCKVKGDVMWITNSAGIALDSIHPDIVYIEKQCHSCKALYKILFQ